MVVHRLILRDPVLWLLAALIVGLVGLAALAGLSGESGGVSSPWLRTDDPALHAVVNGSFPKVAPGVTVGQAFERYRWFTGPAKWMSAGPAASRTVLVSVPLDLPGQAARLGAGSSSAAVFYAAEFGFSGDGKTFRPLSSAIEVRNLSNKLVARLEDRDFLLLRRVLRNQAPGASLERGIDKAR